MCACRDFACPLTADFTGDADNYPRRTPFVRRHLYLIASDVRCVTSQTQKDGDRVSFQFDVRVALGNGTREQRVRITANNAKDAMCAAELQTGGKAMGQYRVADPKPKK